MIYSRHEKGTFVSQITDDSRDHKYTTDLEFSLVLLPSHFAPSEVEPGPSTQGWRDPLLAAIFHLLLNTCTVTQGPTESKGKEEQEKGTQALGDSTLNTSMITFFKKCIKMPEFTLVNKKRCHSNHVHAPKGSSVHWLNSCKVHISITEKESRPSCVFWPSTCPSC